MLLLTLLFIIMVYMCSKYLDEATVTRIMVQVLSALLECHKRKDGVVVHRDIKPANVFLDASCACTLVCLF